MAAVLSYLLCSLAFFGALGVVEFDEVEEGLNKSCSNWVQSSNILSVVPYNNLTLCAKVAAANPACGDFFSFFAGGPNGRGSCKCVKSGDVCDAQVSDEGFQLYKITAGKGAGEAPSIALSGLDAVVPTNAAGEPCLHLRGHCCNSEDYCCDPLAAEWREGRVYTKTACMGSPPVETCGFRFLCGDGIIGLRSSSTEDEEDDDKTEDEPDDEDGDPRQCTEGQYDCQATFEAGGLSYSYCDTEHGCFYDDSTSPASCPCGTSTQSASSGRRAMGFFEAWVACTVMASMPLGLGASV